MAISKDRARELIAQINAELCAMESTLPKGSVEVYPADSEVYLVGEIGSHPDEVNLPAVVDALKQFQNRPVRLMIDSRGGEVDVGVAIFNEIQRHGRVEGVVLGLAASMASYILQACQKRVVLSNASLMVHEPWSRFSGDAAGLRKAAEILEHYRDRLVDGYARRAGKSHSDILAIMAKESWYRGAECVDAGFADEVHIKYGIEASKRPNRDRIQKLVWAMKLAEIDEMLQAPA